MYIINLNTRNYFFIDKEMKFCFKKNIYNIIHMILLFFLSLSSILPFSEMKPQLIYPILKLISKAMSMRNIPFSVDDLKCYILNLKKSHFFNHLLM